MELSTDTRTTRKAGFCTLCRSRCGAVYVVENSTVRAVEPDASHPTGGALCSKGRAAPEMIHSPRRILHPLRRTNPKTDADPGWVEISWDEALSEIADRLGAIARESGPEAVAFSLSSPSATSLSDSIEWIDRFVRTFGSPNTVTGTEVCNWHKDHAHAFTYGVGIPAADYDHADLIMLWGHDPATTWLAQATRIADARNRGAEVVAIDPRGSGSVLGSDQWVRIRPGTDGALALGLANLLIAGDDIDHDFLTNWSNAPYLVRQDSGEFLRSRDVGLDDSNDFVVLVDGVPTSFDPERQTPPLGTRLRAECTLRGRDGEEIICETAFELLAKLCATWPVDRVAKTTWVKSEDIREFAERIARAERISYHSWSGVGQHTNATQTERSIAVLYALTGSFDRRGGNVIYEQLPTNPVTSLDILPEVQREKAIGLAERPLGPGNRGWVRAVDVYDAILDGKPYPVRALFTFGANILLSQPRPERGRRALAALDFAVHCDYFMNPTAELADIVLPVNTAWEREGLRTGFEITQQAQGHVQLRQQMILPRGESRSDLEIIFELAQRLGFGDSFFHGSIDAAWNHVIEPLGITVDELRSEPKGRTFPLETQYEKYRHRHPDGRIAGFATPSRRVEIYSEQFHAHGYSALPEFVEPMHSPTDNYPYVLTSGKLSKFRHTQDRGISSLRRKIPEPVALMHPELGTEHGVSDGDWVAVSTPEGSIRLKAKYDDALHPRVISSSFGWWQSAADLGLSAYDPFSDLGSNYNRIADGGQSDPVSGSLPLKSLKCDVRKLDKQENLHWKDWMPVRVVDVAPETSDTTSLTIEPLTGRAFPRFLPGQYVSIRLDADSAESAAVSRSYSLSGPAVHHNNRYRLTVKSDGPFSHRLATTVRTGDRVEIRAPEGKFRIPLEADLPICLIAAGSGITPFMGYLETLAQSESQSEVHLFTSSRSGEHQVFRKRLEELQRIIPGLTIHSFFTRPGVQDVLGEDFDYEGRLTSDAIPQRLLDQRARFYMCGPEGLLKSMRSGLEERGVFPFEIFEERFSSQGGLATLDPTAQHTVRFRRTGKTLEWTPKDGSLLDFAESHGVPVRGGCRVGQCESCFVKVLSGSVQHSSPDVEPEDDSGCLTCQSVPLEPLELDA